MIEYQVTVQSHYQISIMICWKLLNLQTCCPDRYLLLSRTFTVSLTKLYLYRIFYIDLNIFSIYLWQNLEIFAVLDKFENTLMQRRMEFLTHHTKFKYTFMKRDKKQDIKRSQNNQFWNWKDCRTGNACIQQMLNCKHT